MTHIAVITLAPGQIGFYDDLSGVHLSMTNTEAKIAPGTNVAGLINAVKSGKITVVSGALDSNALAYQEASKAIPTYYRLLEKKKKRMLKNQIMNPVKISEPIVVNPTSEQKIELDITTVDSNLETVEEVVEEKVEVKQEVAAPKKRTRKKKEVIEEVKED